MKSLWLISFCFFSAAAFGSETLTEPIIFDINLGFQETSAAWAANQAGEVYAEQKFENLKWLYFSSKLGTLQRNFLFQLDGSFGSIGSGALSETIKLLSNGALPSADGDTSGYTASALLTLGYMIHLTPDRETKIRLMPLGGYGGSFFLYDLQKVTSPSCETDDAVYNFDPLNQTLRQTWYGFCVGGNLAVLSGENFSVTFQYLYHFCDLKQKAKFKLDVRSIGDTQSENIAYFVEGRIKNGFSHDAFVLVAKQLTRNLSLQSQLHYSYFAASSSPITATQTNGATLERGLTFSTNHEAISITAGLSFVF